MVRAADAVFQECDYSVVDVSADSTTVYTGPCVFYGASVNTALSAHALPIQDGTSVLVTFAASTAAGTDKFIPCGVRCNTSLVVDPNDAASGSVTVYYRKLAAFTP